MKVFVCLSAVFITIVVGQSNPNNDMLCGGIADYEMCKGEWDCKPETSKCFCMSSAPYCRCNNYIGEFYVDTSCTQRWSVLTFALVASLPGIALAMVVGVTVHLIHSYRKPSKSSRAQRNSTDENMFPGMVFASDLNAHPKGPSSVPRPLQGGVPMATIASQPYSTPGNTLPLSDTQPIRGEHRLPYSMSTDKSGSAGLQHPFSYTAGSGKVFSNPYAKAGNPYEGHSPDHYGDYRQPTSPRTYEDSSQFPVNRGAPDHSGGCSSFPRAQIGHANLDGRGVAERTYNTQYY